VATTSCWCSAPTADRLETPLTAGWVQTLASVLPLHHALGGIRELVETGPSATLFVSFGAELAVGAAWLVVALIAFRSSGVGTSRRFVDLAE
jgi:hypothetical protein